MEEMGGDIVSPRRTLESHQNISVTNSQSYASAVTQNQTSLKPFAKLDLSEAQRTALRSILTTAKKNGESRADVQKQIDALLTPAQQKQLAADRAPEAEPNGSSASAASDAAATPASSTPYALTNVQNQAVAAQSTRINALLQQVLSTNVPAALE
jgi:hypothetical protein